MSMYPDEKWQPSYFPKPMLQPRLRILGWWYRFTAPKTSGSGFRMQEIVRQGQLVSNVVLVEMLFALLDSILELQTGHYPVFAIQCVVLLFCGAALCFNRQGHRLASGLLAVLASELGIIFTIVISIYYPGTHLLNGVEFFCLLVQPEILALPLLTTGIIFLLALFNGLFAWALLFVLAHATYPVYILTVLDYQLAIRLSMFFLFVATVAYFWKQSAVQILMRADSAEIVAALEHTMAEQEHATAQKKRVLDENIHDITQTHLQVANGDYSARVPLDRNDILWPIASSLNTLLARIQRLGRLAEKLERTEAEAAHLAAALRAMRTGGPPITFRRNGTSVDLIILELATSVEEPSVKPLKEPSTKPLQVSTMLGEEQRP